MSQRVWRRGDFDVIEAFVAERTGLTSPAPRRASVEAAIRRAAQCAQARTPVELLSRLDADPRLLDGLLSELTVGETYFFRDSAQMEVVRDQIVPGLRALPRPPRIWSAGCATGEEAYSLAILLHESGAGSRAEIVGTDLCRRRLAIARRGLYRRWSLRGVAPERVDRHFHRTSDGFELRSAVRRAVDFRPLNLAALEPLVAEDDGKDLILCRNVLIYFDRETIARVAQVLVGSLAEEGWLFLGASDPLLSDLVPCEVVATPAGVAYRRPRADAPASAEGALPRRERTPAPAGSGPPATLRPPAPPPGAATYPSTRAGAIPPRSGVRPEVAEVRAFADQGRLEEAAHACAAALEAEATCAELWYLRAVLLTEARMHREAVTAARRALYLDRGLAVAHLALGTALARSGEADAARRALENAERLLAALPAAGPVQAAGGEPAGQLLALVRGQLSLIDRRAA